MVLKREGVLTLDVTLGVSPTLAQLSRGPYTWRYAHAYVHAHAHAHAYVHAHAHAFVHAHACGYVCAYAYGTPISTHEPRCTVVRREDAGDASRDEDKKVRIRDTCSVWVTVQRRDMRGEMAH